MSPPYLSIVVILISPFTAIAQPSTPDGYSYSSLTPSMAIIIVVIITAFFFIGFFALFFRQCSNSGTVRGLTNGGRSRRGATVLGLDAAVIESFPTLVYSEVKEHKIGKGALECAVCLCEFEDDETLRLLPKCDHVFHSECIDAWLASRTTCPVCRANLMPESGEPPTQSTESSTPAENDVTERVAPEACESAQVAEPPPQPEPPQVMTVNQTLNRNRTRGSRSGRPRRFPRSHSTGHSLIQPGENTERFTLRLPVEVRKQILNRELNRSMSSVVFTGESSSRKGYKTGGGLEGSSRGNQRRLERFNQGAKSDRWVFNGTPTFFTRASSFLSRASSSVRSTKFTANDGDGTSTRSVRPDSVRLGRPPV